MKHQAYHGENMHGRSLLALRPPACSQALSKYRLPLAKFGSVSQVEVVTFILCPISSTINGFGALSFSIVGNVLYEMLTAAATIVPH